MALDCVLVQLQHVERAEVNERNIVVIAGMTEENSKRVRIIGVSCLPLDGVFIYSGAHGCRLVVGFERRANKAWFCAADHSHTTRQLWSSRTGKDQSSYIDEGHNVTVREKKTLRGGIKGVNCLPPGLYVLMLMVVGWLWWFDLTWRAKRNPDWAS